MMTPEQIDKRYDNRKNQEQKFTAIKQKIEERRNQVYRMNVLGYTNEEIVTNLGVSLSTIEKDLHYMKYYCIKWTKEIIQMGPISRELDASIQIEAAQCELWKLYRNETDKLTKKKFLDSIINSALKKCHTTKIERYYPTETEEVIQLEQELNSEIKQEMTQNEKASMTN